LTTALSDNASSLYEIDCTKPVAFVFGNEHDGVSAEALEKADGNVLIPQVGIVESLNISVACAVTLYEIFRQRNKAGMFDLPQLGSEQRTSMLIDWLMR
jgi:tRNA (guanosine-2'-O-)-methyltransferase